MTAVRTIQDGTLARVLGSYYSAQDIQAGVYVGSEYCIACHQNYAGWRDTRHAKAYRRPLAQYSMKPGLGNVNDYDKNGKDDFADGLDFNAISSVFDPYKPNAPKLSYEGTTYYVTIGELKMPVLYTHGGTGPWKQRWVVRVPLPDGTFSKDAYTSPIQFNEATKAYVLYNVQNWYDTTTKAPLFGKNVTTADLGAKNGGAQSKNCVGCHTTGIKKMEKTAGGEYLYRPYVAVLFRSDDPSYFDFDGDGNADILNIGCEACHGPGSNHILYGGDKTLIVNPAKLTPEKANEVCAQCHNRVRSVPNGTHEWPYKDDVGKQFIPGGAEALSTYLKDDSGLWPDGKSSTKHHQQWPDFDKSGKPAFAFHKVLCTECHEPHHNTKNDHQIIEARVEGTLTIPTATDNNTLCLACHATFGPFATIKKEEVAEYAKNIDKISNVTEAHSFHPYGPERSMGLSRCTLCHMPKVATSGASYDIHSHTFEPIAPEKTLMYQDKGGMPNSCALSCHSTKVNSFGLGLDPTITKWNEAFDVSLANTLKVYFGPAGKWWNTTAPASMTQRILATSVPPELALAPSHTNDD